MRLKELIKREFGKKELEKISPRLRRLIARIDSLPLNRKPISSKKLQEALQ